MSKHEKERLFIKEIQIINCGRFHGEGHTIAFSDSAEQNMTIIIGYSGRGKSTIHDLIYWCLYGEFRSSSQEQSEEVDYGLFNIDALENIPKGKSNTASVTISLHDDRGEKYRLTRELRATHNRESNTRRFQPLNNSKVLAGIDFEPFVKLIQKDEKGQKTMEKNPTLIKNEIRRNFPKNLSDFFLFDGENLVKFKNPANSSEFIKRGITKISGLEIVHYLIENSLTTANSIQKYIGSKSADAAALVATEDRLEEKIKKLDKEIDSKRAEKTKTQAMYDGVLEKIQQNKNSQKILEDQKKTQKSIDNTTKELKQNNNEFKEFLFENLPNILIKDTLEAAEAIFARLENEDKIPPSISSSAIDKILNSEPLKCVCGREFEKNDDEKGPWSILTNMKQTIIEADLAQGISLGRNLMSQIIDNTSAQKLQNKFDEFKETRRTKKRSIDELKAEFAEYDEQIKELDFGEQKEDLADRQKQYREKIDDLSGDIRIDEGELEDLNAKHNDNHKRLESTIEKEKKYDTEQNKIALGKAVNKFSKKLEKRIEEILREKTQKATNDYFLKSAPEKETFDHVSISDNYNITTRDSKDRVVILSKGQAHVLGLSYVAGIREITNTKTFLIIDSPLHNISGISRNDIAKVYSEYLPGVQIVLLVTDTEYLHGDPDGAEPVRSILKRNGKIWKEYELEQVTTSDGIKSRKIKEREEHV